MMGEIEHVAFLATSKGATGVREFLREHCQVAPDVLHKLSTPILLDDEKGGDGNEDTLAAEFGIRLEQLSLRAQREIWSALASGASPNAGAAVGLARAFLQVTAMPRRREIDAVCLSLAKLVLQEDADKKESEQTPTDAAFRRRMRRLILNRVEFPTHDMEDEGVNKVVAFRGLWPAKIALSRSNKRSRGEAVMDQVSMRDSEQGSSEHPPSSIECEVTTPERPLISKEMEDRASSLAKQLAQLVYSEDTAAVNDIASRSFDLLAEVVNDVHTTYAANERSFQYLCKMLHVDSTNDEALYQITCVVVDSNWSSRYAAIFLETSILPKIRTAESVISRVLLQTAFCFGSRYPGVLVESLLLPLLVGGKNDDSNYVVGPPQAEAITRILRNPNAVPADQLDGFLSKSLEALITNENANPLCPHLLSNESALFVFQNILSTKSTLSPLTVERFIGACETVLERPGTGQVRGSLKFATVIFTLISKYPEHCAGHVETLEAIVTQSTSIMVKTTLRCLQKLKASK